MRKKLFTLAVVGLMYAPQKMQSKVNHLLPRPQEVVVQSGSFTLGGMVSITDPTRCQVLQKFFESVGCTIGSGGAPVTVTQVESIAGAYDYTLYGFENEAYTLEVTPTAINITAVTPTGVIRAAQTLTQMAEGWDGEAALEAVTVKDWPAFKLRGYTHDVGRSFISVDELKKHIDLLSRFKVNCFHWHLTENQAWRMEIKAYPQLTGAESMTRFPGQFYTQEQCREVAAYAAERGVVIIPEIDMPGHSAAFERAMGHSMQTDQGVEELKRIIDEVAEVFADAPYLHIGADEVAITYPDFLKTMTDYIHAKGQKVVVWNPIRGVNVGDTGCDMTQMWSTSGRKINGLPNIDCRYNYVNHFDVFADVVGIYKSSIYYADKGNTEIAGSLSAYWNDRKTATEKDIVAQNNMYAAVLATAERTWIGGGKTYIETGGTTLPNSGDEYNEFADWESRFLFHKANSLKNEPIPYVKQTNVRWRITDPVPNGGNSAAVFAPETKGKSADVELMDESFIHEGKTYYSSMATGAGIYLRHTWGSTVPSFFGTADYSNVTSYAWTYVYSPKDQTVGAQIEFQNYGRSENDKAPDAGKWDRKGSDIWINGERIAPPVWDNSGKSINSEVDLKNENFTAREPLAVNLKRGWNKVFLKLPYVGADGVRLNKWMFTCVFTDTEGKNAVEGLIYSPNQCMDEAAEKVAAEVSAKKRDMNNYVGTAVGLWPESVATALKAKIAEIEATYDNTAMTEAERNQQVTELTAAYETFIAALTPEAMNQPVEGKYYRMNTPLRGNRYPATQGVGADIVGEQNPATNASVWKFVTRTDGSYDIQNFHDLSYISPNSSNNTSLKTSAACPATGWTIKAADTKGYVILTSGSAQFNQTNNAGQGFKVFNWGGGANTTDGGCQYAVEEVTVNPDEEGAGAPEATEVPFQTTTIVDGQFAKGTVWYTMQLGSSQNIIADNGSADHIALGRVSTDLEDADLWCFVGNKTDGFKIYNKNAGTSKILASPSEMKAISGVGGTGGGTFPTMQDDASLPDGYVGAWDIQTSDKLTDMDGYYLLLHGTDYAVNNAGGNGKLAFWAEGKDASSTVTFTFAEAELEIMEANGEFTASNPAKTWHSVWSSNQLDGFTLGTGANNMTTENGYIAVYSGQTQSCTHTLTAPEGCVIAAYRFDFKNTGGDNSYGITFNVDGQTYTSSSSLQTVTVMGLDERTATYGQSGANKGVTLSNYWATIRRSVAEPEPRFEVFVYDNGENTIQSRIPAIATAQNGNVIAASDYRYSGADIGMSSSNDGKIDLRYRVSTDNGATWSEIKTMAQAKGYAYGNETGDSLHAAFGDPCIVADRESPRVLVLSCSGMVSFPNGTRTNHQGIARMYSEDNGLTWGSAENIAESIYAQFDKRDDGPVRAMFVGSGKISQSHTVKVGDYYRLYCAVLVKLGNGNNVNFVLYSDDFGGSWTVLGDVNETPIPSGGDEPKADELPDGSVIISSRASGGRYFNIYTFTDSKSGKGYWSNAEFSGQSNNGTAALGNSCNGEIMFVPVVRKSDSRQMFLALQSVPMGPGGRKNVGIYYKGIDRPAAYATPAVFAANWEGHHQASALGSAYSTMTWQKDNTVGFLFEEETYRPAGGYTIVYKNYSIEQITDSLYTYDEASDRAAFAFPPTALDTRMEEIRGMVGTNVGNLKVESLTSVEEAYNVYVKAPSKETYEAFASFLDAAETVGIDSKVMYRLRNSDRQSGTLYLVANAGGLTAATFDESSKTQLFSFIPTDAEDVYYVNNEASKVFIGQTGAQEVEIPVVGEQTEASTYRVVSDKHGRSSLSCTNPQGRPAIHLAGDCSRLVPWNAQGSPASLWYIEPTDLPTGIESLPTLGDETVRAAIYDLSGRRVARPAAGVYIRNGKKYIKK